eukprot:scaffold21426_cov68-Cylindrotheca_fusiformis.AAC.1
MEAKALRNLTEETDKAQERAEEIEREVRQEKGESTVMDKVKDFESKAREQVEGGTEVAAEKANELGGWAAERTNEAQTT